MSDFISKSAARLNINADKAEYSESRTALNRSLSNVPLAVSRAFPG